MASKIIPIEPMGAPRMTQRDRWSKRGVVQRYWAFKDELRLLLPGYELPDTLSLEFHIAMPKSWSAKKRLAMGGTMHQQKPDLDNLIKAFKDTFGADEHVAVYGRMAKLWCVEGEAPCIIIEL